MKFYLQQSFSMAESSVCEGVSDSTTSTSSACCALIALKMVLVKCMDIWDCNTLDMILFLKRNINIENGWRTNCI